MKKITKAGIYLSLAAMLALGTGKTGEAHDYWEADPESEENIYLDAQGVQYYYEENSIKKNMYEKCYWVDRFTQSYDCNNKPLYTKIELLDQIDTTPVKLIGNAFQGHTEIEEITMGNNIWKNSGVFQGCTGLKNIKLSSEITKISDLAFKGCSSLKAIKIPEKCTEIGKNAFEGCTSLNSVYFAKTPQMFKVGKNALKGTAWKNRSKRKRNR